MPTPTLAQMLRNGDQIQGLGGSQSGPVQESDSAGIERALQGLTGWGMGVAGGAGGLIGSDGNPLWGMAGMAPGLTVVGNSQSPNIQDVWAHKMMQAFRGAARGNK